MFTASFKGVLSVSTIARLFLLCLVVLSPYTALAQDLDVERARRAYEDARRIADQARRELTAEQQRFDSVNERYRQAQQRVTQIERDLENARRQVENTRLEIDRLNQLIADNRTDINILENERRSLQSQVTQLTSEIEALRNQIRQLSQEISRLNNEIRQAEADGDTELAARLTNDRNQVQQQEQSTTRTLQQREQDLARARSSLQTTESRIETKRREINNAQARIPQLQSDRDRYRLEVDRLQSDLQLARSALRDRESELSIARSNLSLAQQNVSRAEADERSARQYYEQVQANYNRARDNAIARGQTAGSRDGAREADGRAVSVARTAGDVSARDIGTRTGDNEARQISYAQGYNLARATAGQDASLAGPYSQGISRGKNMAIDKARLEDFPRGFNQQLDTFLARQPTNSETIDISQMIPSDPGEASSLLRLVRKQTQTGASPSYPAASEPAYRLPSAPSPSFSVPAIDRSQYNPPCSGLELPEFDRLCRDYYDSAYPQSFASQYSSVYRSNFQSEFNSRIRGYYDQARSTTHTAENNNGKQTGAEHQGVLDGFANHLPQARQDQFQEGVAELNRQASSGYYLVMRSISVTGEHEDGIISPGEQIKLKVRIDNIGPQATPREKIRFNLTNTNGVTAQVRTRLLPALEGDTAITLEGVLPATVANDVLNNKVTLSAKLESETSSGQFEEIGSLTFEQTVNMPIELVNFQLPANMEVGRPSQVNLTFKNQTNIDLGTSSVNLASDPKDLEFDQVDIDLPAIDAGQTFTVPVDVTPSLTAGSNLLTTIKADLRGIYGIASMVQRQTQRIKIRRNGSLNLCIQNNCDRDVALPLTVRAGGEVNFPVKFAFQATTSQRGPFVLEKETVSSNRITAGNNSLVRVNLGSWSPNSSPYIGNFIYRVPADLQGQEHWVRMRLLENNTPIHSIMIPFKVQ
jgi:archaellum component FlaC